MSWQPSGNIKGPAGSGSGVDDWGTIQLIPNQDYIDVVFNVAQIGTNWTLLESQVVNTIDGDSALNIATGNLSRKLLTGFRLRLLGAPDNSNYYLHWAIKAATPIIGAATTYLLNGPASGPKDTPTTFQVSLPVGTSVPVPVNIIPHDSGAGGTFSPMSVQLTTTLPTASFTYLPSSYGIKTINTTNDGALTDPANISFNVVVTKYLFSGPSSGAVGVASTPFNVQLPAGGVVPAPITIVPDDGSGSLREIGLGLKRIAPRTSPFTPPTVILSTASPSGTFVYTPVSMGAKSMTVANDGGLINPAGLIYVVSDPAVRLLNALVSYWKMDEGGGTRMDSQGSNHLAQTNGPVGVPCALNNGARFVAASQQYLSIGNNASLQVTNDFFFSLWTRFTSQPGPGGGFWIVSKDNPAVGRDYGISYGPTAGFIFSVKDPNTIAVAQGAPVANGVLTHVVAWFDSSDNKLRIRINDATTYVSTMTATLIQSAADFLIGGRSDFSPGLYYDGDADEVGFWKRKPTAQEITALYNRTPFSSFTL